MTENSKIAVAFELLFRDYMPTEEGQKYFLSTVISIDERKKLPEDPEEACAVYFGIDTSE